MQAALGCAAATYDCSVPEKLSSGPSSSSLSLQASSSVSAEAQMHPAHAELVPSDVSGAAAGLARRQRAAQAAAAGQAIATPIALAPLQPFLPPPPPTRSRSEYESAEVSTSFGATKACFNSSHCTFPERCTLESPYRRYCSSNRHVTTPDALGADRRAGARRLWVRALHVTDRAARFWRRGRGRLQRVRGDLRAA